MQQEVNLLKFFTPPNLCTSCVIYHKEAMHYENQFEKSMGKLLQDGLRNVNEFN